MFNANNLFPETPKSFHNKILSTLSQLPEEKENKVMENHQIKKKMSVKRVIIIVAVAVMLLGTTAFAAGKVTSIISSTSKIPTYRSLPDTEQVNADFGFCPKLLEQFNNGYIFDAGYTTKTSDMDENGNTLSKGKELALEYKKGNDTVNMITASKPLSEEEYSTSSKLKFQGITLYESSYSIKFVPVNYEMTEQDQQDEADGRYVFSYGTDEVQVHNYQFINWQQEGISYSLFVCDSNLTAEDLLSMAYQLIDA